MSAPASGVVPANGIQIAYETFGDRVGRPLLMVMGLGAPMLTWHPDLCKLLAGRGFFVIRYDNRDVGRSTHLHDAPPASRIAWIAGGPKVPVEVAASGPKVIAIAALHADRVMFALGADVERLKWGIALAKKTRREAGLDSDAIAYGAYINVGCHTDVAVARNLVRGGLTTFARFSMMHGKTEVPTSTGDQKVLEKLITNYDMKAHTRGDSRQATTLTDDFVDRMAIVGSPERCIERLQELKALGLDKVAISGATRGASEEDAAVGRRLMAEKVIPGLAS